MNERALEFKERFLGDSKYDMRKKIGEVLEFGVCKDVKILRDTSLSITICIGAQPEGKLTVIYDINSHKLWLHEMDNINNLSFEILNKLNKGLLELFKDEEIEVADDNGCDQCDGCEYCGECFDDTLTMSISLEDNDDFVDLCKHLKELNDVLHKEKIPADTPLEDIDGFGDLANELLKMTGQISKEFDKLLNL